MKFHPTSPVLTILLLSGAILVCRPVQADTLKLKDGSPPLEGRVIEQTADSVTFEYRPFPSIKERKVFKKDQIAELKIQMPDEVEYLALKPLVPTPDMLGPVDYQKTITEQLQPYLAKHGKSPFAKDVQAILSTMEEELGKVTSGWQKVDGQWIPPEERVWNAYVIEAKIESLKMKADLEKKDYKSAIDRTCRLEKKYIATESYSKALEQYPGLLQKYEQQLAEMIKDNEILLKKRDEQLKSLDNAGQAAAKAAWNKEEIEVKEKLAQEKKEQLPVTTAHPALRFTIQDAQNTVTREKVRVEKIDREKIKKGAELVMKALQERGKANSAGALLLLEEALKIHGADASIKAMRDETKKAAEEAARNRPILPAPVKSPSSSTPTATPAPAGEKKPPATGSATPAQPDKPAPSTSTKPAPSGAGSTSTPTRPTAVVQEEPDYTNYLLMGAGVLVAAGAVFAILRSRKNKQEQNAQSDAEADE